MSHVASELRHLRREVVRLNRKLAVQRLPGKVVERNAETRMVRLELGTDPDSGDAVKSPWVQVASTGAGAFKGFVLPSIGEQMYLHSSSGVIGADSVAQHGVFTDSNPPPAQEADEAVLYQNGTTRISVKNGTIAHTIGGVTHTLTAQGLEVTGGTIKNNGKSVGSDHKHSNVQNGGGQSGPPVG